MRSLRKWIEIKKFRVAKWLLLTTISAKHTSYFTAQTIDAVEYIDQLLVWSK